MLRYAKPVICVTLRQACHLCNAMLRHACDMCYASSQVWWVSRYATSVIGVTLRHTCDSTLNINLDRDRVRDKQTEMTERWQMQRRTMMRRTREAKGKEKKAAEKKAQNRWGVKWKTEKTVEENKKTKRKEKRNKSNRVRTTDAFWRTARVLVFECTCL